MTNNIFVKRPFVLSRFISLIWVNLGHGCINNTTRSFSLECFGAEVIFLGVFQSQRIGGRPALRTTYVPLLRDFLPGVLPPIHANVGHGASTLVLDWRPRRQCCGETAGKRGRRLIKIPDHQLGASRSRISNTFRFPVFFGGGCELPDCVDDLSFGFYTLHGYSFWPRRSRDDTPSCYWNHLFLAT